MAIENTEDVFKGFGIGTLAVILTALFIALISVPVILFSGWVLSLGWNMLMPKAFGLPELSIYQAIAIDLFVNFLVSKGHGKDERKTWEKILTPFLSSGMFLLIAYILSFYL